MTTALAPERTRKALVAKKARKPRVWTCAFCKNGVCGSCPGMLRVQDECWLCVCGADHRPVYCHECKNENVDEVNVETWRCIDANVCHGRVQARRENNELWQMLQRCKSAGALERKRKRLMAELAAAGIDPHTDAQIEQLVEDLEQAEAQRKRSRPKKPSRPKGGTCECPCGGPTKGGRFIPGHDAKLASVLKNRVKGGDRAAFEEMVRRNWTRKLPVDLRNGPVTP